MNLGIVIINYRSERWLPRCLTSIFVPEFEGCCWLVDNHELDAGLLSDLRAAYPRLRYYQTDGSLGFGRANNLGVELAAGEGADIIGIVNPDLWFEDGWVRPVLSTFADHPDIGAVAPLQLDYDSEALAEWTRIVLKADSLNDPRFLQAHIDVNWLEASAMFIRRQLFEDVGGFDWLFDLYYEDNELCRRVRLAGYRQVVVPFARYHHYGGSTLGGRASVERKVRCDLGQMLYGLTDPERSFAANVGSTTRLLLRRAVQWIGGQNPGFPRLLSRAVPLLWDKRAEIYRKWRVDRRQYVAAH